ncbi:MAG: hypothetical protein OXT09_32190 [Myxococcales bacterium]|nr:hypothetical protein [Myxococcales bacterium]
MPASVVPSKAELVAAGLRQHSRALRSFVHARVEPADRDDVLQTAAVRAMERADSLRDPERVLSWLYRLHRNVIIDAARLRARQQRLLERNAVPRSQATVDPDEPCGCSVSQSRRIHPAYASILALVDAGTPR